ncbi:antA/AntB antirepressor family protein, partial [Klebsiella pneumoniae]
MNELIKISSNENDEQVVSARELHKGIGVKTRFSLWWEQNSRMLIENEDFTSVVSTTEVKNNGGIQVRELQDYALTID